jgi:hypothetical protein
MAELNIKSERYAEIMPYVVPEQLIFSPVLVIFLLSHSAAQIAVEVCL